MSAPNLGRLVAEVNRFEAMADLPTFEEKRKALLKKCDELFAKAEVGRIYTSKNGDQHNDPDFGCMAKVTELAARLLGVLAEAERRAKDDGGVATTTEIEPLLQLLRSLGYEIKRAA